LALKENVSLKRNKILPGRDSFGSVP